MIRTVIAVLTLSLFVIVDGFAAEPQKTQRGEKASFEDFPVTSAERFKDKPAPVRLATREARRYRTAIREGAREGPNFAGHYTIVQWGCGAGCVQFAVVDAKSGAVFMPTFYVGPRALVEGQSGEPDEPLQFRIDSRLLIVSGAPNEKNEGVYRYTWDGKRLRLLSKAPFSKPQERGGTDVNKWSVT